MSRAKLVGKISVRHVFGSKGEILSVVMQDKEVSHKLMRVVGIASDIKTGEGDNGPWTGLKGQFKATNLVTGEVFQSGQCFLPGVASDMVEGALKSGASAVEFGFDISVVFDENSATSYVYYAEPLFDTAENDPVALLSARLEAEQKKLEAPKDVKKEPVPEKKK